MDKKEIDGRNRMKKDLKSYRKNAVAKTDLHKNEWVYYNKPIKLGLNMFLLHINVSTFSF